MSENPYQAPQEISPPDIPAGGMERDEAIRKEYIRHENSIKSIGIVFYIIGGLAAISLLALFALAPFGSRNLGGPEVAIIFFALLTGGFYIVTGYHLRKFAPWARIAAIVLSFLLLLRLPIGTVFGIIFLVNLFSGKNQMVFSDYYREVVAVTPHVKAKPQPLMWILLGILVLGGGAAVALAFWGMPAAR